MYRVHHQNQEVIIRLPLYIILDKMLLVVKLSISKVALTIKLLTQSGYMYRQNMALHY